MQIFLKLYINIRIYLDCKKVILLFFFVFCLVLGRVLCSLDRSLMLGLQACVTMLVHVYVFKCMHVYMCLHTLCLLSAGIKVYISWQTAPLSRSPAYPLVYKASTLLIDLSTQLFNYLSLKAYFLCIFLSEQYVTMHKTDGNPHLGWGVGLVIRVDTTLLEDPCQVAHNCL